MADERKATTVAEQNPPMAIEKGQITDELVSPQAVKESASKKRPFALPAPPDQSPLDKLLHPGRRKSTHHIV